MKNNIYNNPALQRILKKTYNADIDKNTPKYPESKINEPLKEKKKEVNQSPFLDL